MVGSMAEKWQEIGRIPADDKAIEKWYSVIVQNWTMAAGRL